MKVIGQNIQAQENYANTKISIPFAPLLYKLFAKSVLGPLRSSSRDVCLYIYMSPFVVIFVEASPNPPLAQGNMWVWKVSSPTAVPPCCQSEYVQEGASAVSDWQNLLVGKATLLEPFCPDLTAGAETLNIQTHSDSDSDSDTLLWMSLYIKVALH